MVGGWEHKVLQAGCCRAGDKTGEIVMMDRKGTGICLLESQSIVATQVRQRVFVLMDIWLKGFRRRRKPASTKRVLGVHRDWRQGERRVYCGAGEWIWSDSDGGRGSRMGTASLNPDLVFLVSHDWHKGWEEGESWVCYKVWWSPQGMGVGREERPL